MSLLCNRLHADEILSFMGMKQKNVQDEFDYGCVYAWTVIDADTMIDPYRHVWNT